MTENLYGTIEASIRWPRHKDESLHDYRDRRDRNVRRWRARESIGSFIRAYQMESAAVRLALEQLWTSASGLSLEYEE